jgi:uncharacterized protein (TIGR02646 family)
MRLIRKFAQPIELKRWRDAHRKGPNFNYFEMTRDTKVRIALVDRLLQEQGGLCAYTGIRVDNNDNFHFEHLKARAHCQNGEDSSYKNLVACYPKPISGVSYEYGAIAKGQWPNYAIPAQVRLFISPIDRHCITSFIYEDNGAISCDPTNTAAATTIERLALDHPTLTALRQRAIIGALRPLSKPLTLLQAQQLKKVVSRPQNNRLPAFCFVLDQALTRYINRF